MNFKKISLLIVLLLIADQALKIWIKTHMHLDESIVVFPDWFQLRFIENNGAAFGMHIASSCCWASSGSSWSDSSAG